MSFVTHTWNALDYIYPSSLDLCSSPRWFIATVWDGILRLLRPTILIPMLDITIGNRIPLNISLLWYLTTICIFRAVWLINFLQASVASTCGLDAKWHILLGDSFTKPLPYSVKFSLQRFVTWILIFCGIFKDTNWRPNQHILETCRLDSTPDYYHILGFVYVTLFLFVIWL